MNAEVSCWVQNPRKVRSVIKFGSNAETMSFLNNPTTQICQHHGLSSADMTCLLLNPHPQPYDVNSVTLDSIFYLLPSSPDCIVANYGAECVLIKTLNYSESPFGRILDHLFAHVKVELYTIDPVETLVYTQEEIRTMTARLAVEVIRKVKSESMNHLMVFVVQQPVPDRRALKYNKILNAKDFIDPHGMLDALVQHTEEAFKAVYGDDWIYGIHSPTFCIIQSKGTGKTKLVRQLPTKGFWLFHLVCRDSPERNMKRCPIIEMMLQKCKVLVEEKVRQYPELKEVLETGKGKTDALRKIRDEVLNPLATQFLHYFAGCLQFLFRWQLQNRGGDPEAFAKLFRYAESEEERREIDERWWSIISQSQTIDFVTPLLSISPTPRIIMCFDDASGLFGDEGVMDESHSIELRSIRRACARIKNFLQVRKMTNLSFAFIMVDSTGQIDRFPPYKIRNEDRPDFWDVEDNGQRLFYPIFPFLLTQNIMSSSIVSESYHEMRFNYGRPLWQALFRIEKRLKAKEPLIDRLIEQVSHGIKPDDAETVVASFDQIDFKSFVCLASRIPVIISPKSPMSVMLMEKAFGIAHFIGDNVCHVSYPADPVLAAAAERISVKHPVHIAQTLRLYLEYHYRNVMSDELVGRLIFYFITVSSGTFWGEDWRPFCRYDFHRWFIRWLGDEKDDDNNELWPHLDTVRRLPDWTQKAKMICHQIVQVDDWWDRIELAAEAQVGLAPMDPIEAGWDLIVPLPIEGQPCALLVCKVLNQEEPVSEADKVKFLEACRRIPKTKKMLPIIYSMSHGLGMDPDYGSSSDGRAQAFVCVDLETGTFESFRLILTPDNTNNSKELILELLKSFRQDPRGLAHWRALCKERHVKKPKLRIERLSSLL